MRIAILSSAALIALSASPASANDYPTQARVEFVFDCMQQNEGVNYVNLYHCSCIIDRVANNLSYDDYVYADTLTRGRDAWGERGGIFRQAPGAKKVRKVFARVLEDAKSSCIPATISKKVP